MTLSLNNTVIEIVQGDITELDVEAVVNPANSSLILGGGVAGAIRTKGGGSIQAECDKIGDCPLGGAVVTGGGVLKAKYVIHAVGPRFGVDPEPDKKLRSAVNQSLLKVCEIGAKSVAIPAVSTGIFGYPIEEAAEIILSEIFDFVLKNNNDELLRVIICLYDDKTLNIFLKTAKKYNKN